MEKKCEVYCYENSEAVDYKMFDSLEDAVNWGNRMIAPSIERHENGKITHHATYVVIMTE